MRCASLGVGEGGRVFILLGRVPELYVAVLGALKAKCVASPLFSAFGPEPIATRLGPRRGPGSRDHARPVSPQGGAMRGRLPKLAHVLLIDGEETEPDTLSGRA